MSSGSPLSSQYQRYHIDTQPTPDIVPWPNRFLVQVSKIGLAKLLIQEIFKQRGDMKAVTSRPCMYGTFSGPVGGFAPRPQHCVGCLRCTTQHPDMVQIMPNPARQKLGDSYFDFRHINAAAYEAESGSVPVKGAGYRGPFGGAGWDGMWTDMSEIVRPTRDGIHGREFISTVVDLGEKPGYLVFDAQGQPIGAMPRTFSIPIPFIYDQPPGSAVSPVLAKTLVKAAMETQTLVVLPISLITKYQLSSPYIVPLLKPGEEIQFANLAFGPQMVEIDAGETAIYALEKTIQHLQASTPDAVLALRLPYVDPDSLRAYFNLGMRVFHLMADYHGRSPDGRFAIELIREAHLAFVETGVRDQITLIGSGGIVAAEHVPKAIICGLDLVALDTPLLVALQAHFEGECNSPKTSDFTLPADISIDWGVQRLKNLTAAWRDQLLEILGAMGLREVRRLRGEMGRAMFQIDLEREAFAEIEGYRDK
jgi:hypothetical protein